MTDSVQPESGSRAFRWRLFALCFALLSPPAEAGWFRALEPHHLTREPGPPSSVRLPFEVLDPSLPYRVRIFNGGASGTGEPIASAVVRLNGQRIFGPVAFRRAGRGTLDKAVALRSSNLLAIRIFGHRGTMTVLVLGRDDGAPIIEARVTPPANAAGWHNADDVAAGGVTVEFDCSDAESGIDSCSEPVVLDTEGTAQVVTGTAIDLAGNVATASAVVDLDVTPPMIGVVEPVDGATTGVEVPTEGSIVDDLSGVAFAEVDGSPLALSASSDFAQTIGVPAGLHTLMYTAEDVAGNRADAQVDIEAVGSSGVKVEFLSPGPGSIQYGSGWPLTLQVTLPEEMIGIGVVPKGGNGDDFRNGPFPQRGSTGFMVLEDPDRCPSFVDFFFFQASCHDSRTFEYKGEQVHWYSECRDNSLGDEFPPENELLIEFTPGVDAGGDAQLLPALVVIPDTGRRLRVDRGSLVGAPNVADWNSVSYQLKDSRALTSITAHMNVDNNDSPLWPRVDYEVPDTPFDGRTALYRVDYGLRDCLPGDTGVGGAPHHCIRSTPMETSFVCETPRKEGRMEDLYIPIFEAVETTLRAAVVALNEGDRAPCEILNLNDDNVIDLSDVETDPASGLPSFRGYPFDAAPPACDRSQEALYYPVLSNLAETRYHLRFGAPCALSGRLFLEDVDGKNGTENEMDNQPFCDDDEIPESSPVSAGEPPR